MNLFRKLAVAVLFFGFLAFPAPGHAARSCWDYIDAERAFITKINRARNAHGVRRLDPDRHIARVSRYYVHEMLRSGSLFHTPFSKLSWRVTNEVALGENIGYAGGVRKLFRLMMSSSLHRANILNPAWTHLGVGTGRKNGRLWTTMTFEARRDPGTRLSMPKC